MSNELKPCHCGYSGALMGMQHNGYLSLTCPECRRYANAFTMNGLVDAWNKPKEQPAEVKS